MPEVKANKKRMIVAYREKKGLCTFCGRGEPDYEHICKENYVKSDMREVDLNESEIFSVSERGEKCHADNEEVIESAPTPVLMDEREVRPEEETEEKVMPELTARIKTIISYRQRKNLCVNCGCDIHEGTDCNSDFTETDLRPDDDKETDPRTVKTPKSKTNTILEDFQIESINQEYLAKTDNPFMRLDETEVIQTTHPYLILDLTPSDNGQIIESEYVKFIAHKHKSHIIFTIGDYAEKYSLFEKNQIIKLNNVKSITNLLDQNIVNFLCGCDRMFGFPSSYVTYCMTRNIPTTTFFDNSDLEYDLPCNIVSISDDENVNLGVIKQDVLSWRI